MKNLLIATVILAAAHAQAGDFQLKNRSTFDGASSAHNPFWPIGWTKPAIAATPGAGAVTKAVAVLKPENFVVTSILLNEPALAVVNGKEIAEGEVVAMNVDSQQLLIQLASVQDGQVVLRYQGQNVIVPLHRKGEQRPITDPRTALR